MKSKRPSKRSKVECADEDDVEMKSSRTSGELAVDCSDPSRECEFTVKEKVIGYYGRWPYVGVVQSIASIQMTFGILYIVLIKWNGFSGKNASTWISEDDVLKYTDENISMKAEMDASRREKLNAVRGKADVVKQRKIFSEVISMFSRPSIAPFAPLVCPFPDEWQTIVRLTAIPESLYAHLNMSEELVYTQRLVLPGSHEIVTVFDTLSQWNGPSEFTETILGLFDKYFMDSLVYKFEIPFVVQQVQAGGLQFSKSFSTEYLLRLLIMMPQLLTASHSGVLFKDSPQAKSLFELCEINQSLLKFLETNIETLLRRPVRLAVREESLPVTYWLKDVPAAEIEEKKSTCKDDSLGVKEGETKTFIPSKWKRRMPIRRPPVGPTGA